MGFFYGLIAILFVIFLLTYTRIKKPLFGNILIAITVLLISLVTLFYFQLDKRVEKKQQLISIEEIKLSQIHHALAYGNNYKLTAKVENLSARYRLQAINIQIDFSKCLPKAQQTKCSQIKQHQYRIKTRIAANDSTNIEKYIMLDDIDPLKENETLQWDVKIISGIAR